MILEKDKSKASVWFVYTQSRVCSRAAGSILGKDRLSSACK